MSFSFLLRSDRARFLTPADGPKRLVFASDGVRETAARQLERVSFYGAVLAVAIAAVPYGTVEPWHKAVLVSAFAVLGLFRVMGGLMRGTFRLAEPVLLAPPLGVLGLAVVQVVPSPSTGGTISLDP